MNQSIHSVYLVIGKHYSFNRSKLEENKVNKGMRLKIKTNKNKNEYLLQYKWCL